MIKIIERITYKNDDTIEKTTQKIEIPGKINGQTMLSAVMDLQGWNLVIKNLSNDTSMIIKSDHASDLKTLEVLLKKTIISIAIQVPLNLPLPPGTNDD